MFTGIVEERGEVVGIDSGADAARLSVRAAVVTDGLGLGESVAVDGVCLTVAALDGQVFTVDVMAETLRRSTLGARRPGDAVNLERAVTPQTRLGGHLVQGHVDGTGSVVDRHDGEHWVVLTVTAPPPVARYLVPQGSVAVDGVSLTVVDVDGDAFTVSLVPATLQSTNLGLRQPGDRVNLEADVVAKYVERLVTATAGGRS